MSRHILVVKGTREDREYTVVCPDGNGCSGWIECREPHKGDPHNYGPWACPMICIYGIETVHMPFCEVNEFEFHGILHTWNDGFGWTIPYNGCIVQFSDWDTSEFSKLSPGEYEVEDVWDEEFCFLELVNR